MNLYLASNEHPVYVALYEQDGQTLLRRWSHVGRFTPDSLALENAIDGLEQITHIIPLTIYTPNAYLLKGCTTHWLERQQQMNSQMAVPHIKLWQMLDRHLDEWTSHGVTLEWRQGSHPKALAQLQRR